MKKYILIIFTIIILWFISYLLFMKYSEKEVVYNDVIWERINPVWWIAEDKLNVTVSKINFNN